MRRIASTLTFALLASLAIASAARADDRYFPFSYPYNTPARGERELELYSDITASGLQNQLEFELGLTNHWSASVYGVFHNLQQFDGYILESRYRLAEQNVLPVDTGLYLEYSDVGEDGPSVEGKLLLEKTLGAWIVDANLIAERHFRPGTSELNATLAAGYTLAEGQVAGLEAYYNANKLYVGPTFAYFPWSFHATGGVYYGGANEVLGRLVASQEF